MANKFEMGSSEFLIPQATDKHYTEEEFKQKQDMYDAIDYISGVDPVEYEKNRNNKQVSKKAVEKIIKFREHHIDTKELDKELKEAKSKKVGAKMISFKNIFSRAA